MINIAERLGNIPKICDHVLKETEDASVVVFRQSLNESGASS